MIFATHKAPLLKALDRISSVVKSNPRSIDVLQGVKVESLSNEVYLISTSSMASVRVLVEGAKVSVPGKFVVNYDKFRDRVSKSGNAMRVEVCDESLRITSSEDQRLGIPLNDLREFPEISWSDPEESYGLSVGEVATLFKTAASITSQVTSLTPAFLQVHIRNQMLWGANQVSYHRIPLECNPSMDVRIPTVTLSAIVKFIQDSEGDKVWMSQVGGDHVVVTVGKDQFQATPLALPFPDLEQVFQHTQVRVGTELRVDRKRLVEELAKSKTSAGSLGKVTLTVEGLPLTPLKIHTQSDHGDWYESTVPRCLWGGSEERSWVFNIDTLLQFLRSFREDEIVLETGDDFKGDLTPFLCQEGEHLAIINQFRV